MPKLTILPLGLTIEAEEGTTIMEAAGEPMASTGLPPVGARASARPVACSIDQGEGSLEKMGRSERKTLTGEFSEAAIEGQRLRLACQARLHGDVQVSKRGVRAAASARLNPE